MGANERRMAIWHTLCAQRQVTIAYLAEKYHVSKRTVRYDVEILSRVYPIETRSGKNGGIRVADWFQPSENMLMPVQMDLLLQLHKDMDGNDAIMMGDIIAALGKKG